MIEAHVDNSTSGLNEVKKIMLTHTDNSSNCNTDRVLSEAGSKQQPVSQRL